MYSTNEQRKRCFRSGALKFHFSQIFWSRELSSAPFHRFMICRFDTRTIIEMQIACEACTLHRLFIRFLPVYAFCTTSTFFTIFGKFFFLENPMFWSKKRFYGLLSFCTNLTWKFFVLNSWKSVVLSKNHKYYYTILFFTPNISYNFKWKIRHFCYHPCKSKFSNFSN